MIEKLPIYSTRVLFLLAVVNSAVDFGKLRYKRSLVYETEAMQKSINFFMSRIKRCV